MKVRGLPILVLNPRRDLPDSKALKTPAMTRRPNGVYVSLDYDVQVEPLPNTSRAVGL